MPQRTQLTATIITAVNGEITTTQSENQGRSLDSFRGYECFWKWRFRARVSQNYRALRVHHKTLPIMRQEDPLVNETNCFSRCSETKASVWSNLINRETSSRFSPVFR